MTDRNLTIRLHELGRALLGSGLARISGLLLAAVIAALYGANTETDALYLALGVTLYAFEILRISFEGAVVPALTRLLHEDQVAAERLVGGWIRWWVIAAGGLACVVVPLAAWVVTGADPTAGLALDYGAALVVLAVPMGIAALATSVLAARGQFLASRAADSARPLGAATGAVALHGTLGLWGVILGYAVGTVVQLALVVTLVRRSGFHFHMSAGLGDLTGQLGLAGPIVAGSLLLNLNPLVDRFVAAVMLDSGNVTIYENASRLFGAMTSLLYGSVGIVLVRHWSVLRARDELHELRSSFQRLCVITAWGVVPASVLLWLGADPLIRFVLGRGVYDPAAVQLTVSSFLALVAGLGPFFLAAMGSRLLYALEFTKIALVVGVVAVPLNLAFDITLAPRFGVVGIALGTTLTYAVVAAVVLRDVWRRLRLHGQGPALLRANPNAIKLRGE